MVSRVHSELEGMGWIFSTIYFIKDFRWWILWGESIVLKNDWYCFLTKEYCFKPFKHAKCFFLNFVEEKNPSPSNNSSYWLSSYLLWVTYLLVLTLTLTEDFGEQAVEWIFELWRVVLQNHVFYIVSRRKLHGVWDSTGEICSTPKMTCA